jgi:hypothetical protein
MKVIFLDNDGVICLRSNWGSRFKKQKKYKGDLSGRERPFEVRADNFDRKAVRVLNEILEETGAEIIISSDWRRLGSLEELQEYYLTQGIVKAPVGLTKIFSKVKIPDHFPWNRGYSSEQERSLEILDWLSDHPEITQWVAVDDLDMSTRNGWGLSNFVHTPIDTEGIKQTGVKKKILDSLI